MRGEVLRAGQLEPGTRLACESCGARVEARNRNGITKRFCSERCRNRFKNALRLKGAAALMVSQNRKPRTPSGPSRHAQRVSREVFQSIVPVDERAELIRQACANLGITDPAAIDAALRRNGRLPRHQMGAA